MRRLLHHADKLALAASVLLLLGAAYWAAGSFEKIDAISSLNPAGLTAPKAIEPQMVQMPTINQVTWPDPPQQSRGADWVYDTFTPPVIWYDPNARSFTVTRPELQIVTEPDEEVPFEVELVSVRQEPYRIQLVGYSGAESDYIAQLQIVETGEVVLGRAGAEFSGPTRDFVLRHFDVRQVTTRTAGSMPILETVGFATILDNRTGREVELTTRERVMLPRLQCVLRTLVYPREEHVLREGMKITVNGYDYLVVRLSLNPAQAEVSRRDPRTFSGENRTLYPVGQIGASRGAGAGRGRSDAIAHGFPGAGRDNSIDSRRDSLFFN